MGRSKRSSPQGDDRGREWLGLRQPARARPWAYEEQLFGSDGDAERSDELTSLAAGLALDLAELKRMQNELLDQVVRIAALEERVQALRRSPEGIPTERAGEPAAEVEVRSFPSRPIRRHPATRAGSPLARCDGFRVDSPVGTLGFVEGVRFASRIDQPDVLEVRGGRFGRQLMLIPIEEVEEISVADERLVVRTSELPDDHLHELVSRLRRVLHHPASSGPSPRS